MLTNESYHKDTKYVSKSGLDLVNRAPALYYHKYLDPNKPKEEFNEAFLVGGAFHTFVLEPHLLATEYVVMPDYKGVGSMAKKDEFKRRNATKNIIPHSIYMQIDGMTKSVLSHPIASKLFTGGIAEQTHVWIDKDTGVMCKCRPDYTKIVKKTIVDLKSTDDASENGFKRSAIKFRYDVQSAFYTDGLRANNFDIENFIFVAVEKKPPYLVNVFFADTETMEVGREKYKENLITYAECSFNDEWEGYSEIIKPLGIEY